MAKRLTATDKWADPWFCSLSERDRLFWIYILDNCDHAGIWRPNSMLIEVFFPGYGLDFSRFGDRIIRVDAEKWFIPKFITFQYPGGLNKDNRAHQSVIDLLKREGLWPLPQKEKRSLPSPHLEGPSKPLTSPIEGCKDKDKDKELELVKDKDKDNISRAPASITCEYCGPILNHANHRKCHFCFKIYTAGENDDNHRCPS